MIIVSVMMKSQTLLMLNYMNQIDGLYLDSDLLQDLKTDIDLMNQLEKTASKIYIKLPQIIRSSDRTFLENTFEIIEQYHFKGVVCSTIDAVGLSKEEKPSLELIADASLYTWNKESYLFKEENFDAVTLPYELNSKEIKLLCNSIKNTEKLESIVYGRIPLMVTANCVKLTSGNCNHKRECNFTLTDRMDIKFPVYTNCNHCYNVIYNHIPLFIFEDLWMLKEDGVNRFRIELTDESTALSEKIVKTFLDMESSNSNRKKNTLGIETTNGHFRRGVE